MKARYTIAITGKGGTGKTTIAAALVTCLVDEGCTPVLAVDADPNSCLDNVLGVQVMKTVGQIREESRDAGAGQPAGMAKRELVEMRIHESLVEASDFDLIAMGRPEGPGCYCYANNLFGDCINALSKNYPFIVIDNEAGLENLSRRLYRAVDLLVIVGDPSRRGIETIRRLHALAKEMGVEYGKLAVVVNLVREGTNTGDLSPSFREMGADLFLMLPFNSELAKAGEEGAPMQDVPRSNPVLSGIAGLISHLNLAGETCGRKETENS